MYVVFVQNHIRLSNLFRLSNCTQCTVLIESSQFFFFFTQPECVRKAYLQVDSQIVSFHFWRSRFNPTSIRSLHLLDLKAVSAFLLVSNYFSTCPGHHKLRLCDGNEERLQICASCPQPHCFNSPPKVGEGTCQLPALPVSLPLPDGSQFRNLFLLKPFSPQKNHLLFNSRPFCSI